MLTKIAILPFVSWLLAVIFVVNFGEVVVNKNIFEEWLIAIVVILIFSVLNFLRKKFRKNTINRV